MPTSEENGIANKGIVLQWLFWTRKTSKLW